MRNHHFDSIIGNDFQFRDDDIIIANTSRRKSINHLSGQRLSFVSPLKRHSHRAVEVLDKL